MVKYAINEVKAQEICDDVNERIFRNGLNITWLSSGYESPKNEVTIQIFPSPSDIRLAMYGNPAYVLRNAIEEKFPDLDSQQERYHTKYLFRQEAHGRGAIHLHGCLWVPVRTPNE